MTVRQLIAVFLSTLLLTGGPAVGAVLDKSSHADMAGCGTLSHETSDLGSEISNSCNEPSQLYCCVSAPHCSFASVYGLLAGSLVIPLKLPGQFTSSQARTAYQNPIPEVLTPPPDFLS